MVNNSPARSPDDGKGKDAAQRRGYRFLTSCLPDSFVLGSAARG
jgi:hypothetical protein